eukprot:g6579.t1
MSTNRNVQAKNRAPASIQITAEQILREAKDRQLDVEVKAPRQQITDEEELRVFRMRKRKEFEDAIRKQREHIGNWMKYSTWEESQMEFERARSVYERALEVDYRNQTIWLRYAEFEMRSKFPNHARNVWDRAVALLPRVDQFWYKYSYMEEMLGNPAKARAIFERWMEWEPEDNAWSAYVKFEMRQEEPAKARSVFQRYVEAHPHSRAFLKWARWEDKQSQYALARGVYERALAELPDSEKTEKLFSAFAHFEERCKEFDRARVIYKYALDQMPREQVPELYRDFIGFEKRHGSVQGIEEVIMNNRRLQYEERASASPLDYDNWFDYLRLEESTGDLDRTREVYERAIANVPPVVEKRYWRRYIYLWINYALFEELQAEDAQRTREVYRACLDVIPHKSFTFAKIWLMLAKFEVRHKDLQAARKVLGQAIGMCPKEKLFKGYVQLERDLGEIDRCRKVYSKCLEAFPSDCGVWAQFAALEGSVGETERSRAVFELAIRQPVLDMPETLWKAYIDFEAENGETELARQLFERLLERTQHVKVWISYAQFEAKTEIETARGVFRRGYDHLRRQGLKEERVKLLEAWRAAEKAEGKGKTQGLQEVESKMPRKFKKRRMMTGTNGEGMGWEEYYDYQFPDDETKPANLKILEMAQKWKKKGAGEDGLAGFKLGGAGGGSGGAGLGEENGGGGGGTKRKQEELGGAGRGADAEEIQLEEEEEEEEEGERQAGEEPQKNKRKRSSRDGEETGKEEEEEEEEERAP